MAYYCWHIAIMKELRRDPANVQEAETLKVQTGVCRPHLPYEHYNITLFKPMELGFCCLQIKMFKSIV